MIFEKGGRTLKNYHEREIGRKLKTINMEERRLMVWRHQQKGFRPTGHKDLKRPSLVLKSTSRARSGGRRRMETPIRGTSDLQGAAQEMLISSGQDTNFRLTLEDGKGNSLTLAWTHIDPAETEHNKHKSRHCRNRADEEVAKKKKLIEEDFKQWMTAKLEFRGT